jgi:ATP synthase protein I
MTTYGDGAANAMTTAKTNTTAKSKKTNTTANAKTRKTSRPVTYRSQVWQRSKVEGHASRAKGLDTGWTIFSYLIGGMIAYGAIGWGIGKAVHIGWLFSVGMLVGLAISLGFVIHRYGRQAAGVRGDGSPRSRALEYRDDRQVNRHEEGMTGDR